MAKLGEVIVTYEQIGEALVFAHIRCGKWHHWKLYDMQELAQESGRTLEDVRTSIMKGAKEWQQRIIISPK